MVGSGSVYFCPAASDRSVACAVTVLLLLLVVTPAAAQRTEGEQPANGEAATLARGWTALAQGDLAQASSAAQRAMADAPRSEGALTLAVEVEIVRGGPLAALDTYERWLGAKRVDEPYALRRVAAAYLRKMMRDPKQPARVEALKALVADGEPGAEGDLTKAAFAGAFAETRALASIGDDRAIQILIAQLRAPGGSKLGMINALVESGSKLAVPPLVEMLADLREDHRAAAADALGRLGARDVIPRIKPLLDDPVFPVRMSAAGALYRLEDYGGVNLLEQLLASEHAAVRLSAAEAMSVRPAGVWLSVVRELTRDSDPTVQLGAARLIAPYEPDLAATVLERLRRSENLAVREEAGRIFVQRVAGDFASLRKFLRSSDALTAVRAAGRILELTRG